MIIKNGQVLLFEEDGFVKRDILVKDGKIIWPCFEYHPELWECHPEWWPVKKPGNNP